jgi:phosphoglucosamine mutase
MPRQYFGTDGVRGRVGELPMTPDFLVQLGWAIGQHAQQGTVLIGKDTRLSGYMIEAALIAGLTSAGCSVLTTGPLPTPAIAYLCRQLPEVTLGIMISASHNPYEDNGVKLFDGTGFKLPDSVEQAIEQTITKPLQCVAAKHFGKVKRLKTAATQYVDYACSLFPTQYNLQDLHIVLDCAHGATYHVAPLIFEQLGAKLTVIGYEPNGVNINDHVGSTSPQLLQKMVVAEGADLGIAFDGDGDRVLMVDESGRILDGDDLLYILAQDRSAESGIVGTLMTNFGLECALRELGFDFYRAKVGDRYVLEAMQQRGWWLGGENSGHIIDLHVGTTGDGIVSALQVLACLARHKKSLTSSLRGLKKFPQVLLNVVVSERPAALDHPQLLAAVQRIEASLKDRGRVLLRTSGTEPLIRVMVEGEDETEVTAFAQELVAEVKACYGAL